MGHKSVPIHPISNPIGSGFFESCRARYRLSIRTYDAKSGPAQPEENWRANFEMEEVYRCSFRSGIRLRFGNDG